MILKKKNRLDVPHLTESPIVKTTRASAVLVSRREAASNCPTTIPNQARRPHGGRLAAVARAWHHGVLEKAPVVSPFLLRPNKVVTSGDSLDTTAHPCGRRVARGASRRVGQRTHTIHPPGDAGGMGAKERRGSAVVRCCPLCTLPTPRCQKTPPIRLPVVLSRRR